jgi:hypothetical protein
MGFLIYLKAASLPCRQTGFELVFFLDIECVGSRWRWCGSEWGVTHPLPPLERGKCEGEGCVINSLSYAILAPRF